MVKHKRKIILITAGPTQEPLDPVRFLTNHSSGKMGYSLAASAIKKGFDVILISGPTALKPPPKAKFIRVQTAREMYRSVMDHFRSADIIMKVAAVSDYRPKRVQKKKIKKTDSSLHIELVRNPDILLALGKKIKPHQTLIGFAAETNNIEAFAKKKLKNKNCDWIIANDVSSKAIGFGSDNNQVTLYHRSGKCISLKKPHVKSSGWVDNSSGDGALMLMPFPAESEVF